MAVKTLYFKNVTINGALSLQDGGTAPTGAITTTGWTVAKSAAPNYKIMAVGVKQTTFSSTDALTTPALTVGSSWRSENKFNGTFANTNWSLAFRIRAVSAVSAQTGAVKVRIWKSPNTDGSSATQLTSGILTGTTTAVLSTSASATSTVTWTPGATQTFNNEYLFVQCEWSIVATGGSNSCDAMFYVESAGAITTSDYTAFPVYTVKHFRWRDDSGGVDASPSWVRAEDKSNAWPAKDWSNPQDWPSRLRFAIDNTGGTSSATTWSLEYSKNGGAWTAVTTTSNQGVRAYDVAAIGDNIALTTQRLTAGSGTFGNGQYDATGTTGSLLIAGGTYTELEFALYHDRTQVNEFDTLDYRVVGSGVTVTNSVTPRVTVSRFQEGFAYLTVPAASTYQLTEDATAASGHSATTYFNSIAGKRYSLYVEYDPIGPNPRGLMAVIQSANGSVVMAGLSTGTENAGSLASSGGWTIDTHSVTSVGGGWYGLSLCGVCPDSASMSSVALWLFNDTTNAYNGLDNGSGIQFRNFSLDIYTAKHFRWRNDTAGIDATPTWVHGEDKPLSCWPAISTNNLDWPARLRFAIENTGSGLDTGTLWTLYYSKNGGAWTPVTTTTNQGTHAYDMAGIGDNVALITQRLTVGSGTWVNGQYDATGATGSIALDGGEYTELEFPVYHKCSEVSEFDTIDYRVYAGSIPINWNVTPRVVATRWGEGNAYVTLAAASTLELTEDASTAAVHYVNGSTFNSVAGNKYTFYIEFKPIGPNPRGIIAVCQGSAGYVHTAYTSTGTEISSFVMSSGTWTLDTHSINNIGGGWYSVSYSFYPDTYTGANVVLYLWNDTVAYHVYDGLDDGSGFQFRNVSVTSIRSPLIAESGSYAINGKTATLSRGYTLATAQGSYVYSGKAATLRYQRIALVAARGTYAYAGIAATLRYQRIALISTQGSYTLLGKAATLRYGRVGLAAQGSYTYSGNAVTLRASHIPLMAARGTYAYAGQAVTFDYTPKQHVFVLDAAQGVYALAGKAIGLSFGHGLTAARGTYAYTGQAATLFYSRRLSLAAVQGVYALSGKDATLRFITATNVAQTIPYAITGQAATLRVNRIPLTAARGSYAIAGQAAFLRYGHSLVAAQGSYGLSGKAATLRYNHYLGAAKGSYVDIGNAATLRYITATNLAQTIPYAITGQAVRLSQGHRLIAAQGSYAIAGRAAVRGYSLSLAQGTYAIVGKAAIVKVTRYLTGAKGSYSVIGLTVSLFARGAYSVDAICGSYGITGNAATFLRSRKFLVDSGVYNNFTFGITYTLRRGLRLSSAIGSYSLAGKPIILQYNHRFIAAKGNYTISGNASTNIHSYNLIAASKTYNISGKPANSRRRYQSAVASGAYFVSGRDAILDYVEHLSGRSDSKKFNILGFPVTFLLTNSRSDSYGVAGSDVTFIRTHHKYKTTIIPEPHIVPTVVKEPKGQIRYISEPHIVSTPIKSPSVRPKLKINS